MAFSDYISTASLGDTADKFLTGSWWIVKILLLLGVAGLLIWWQWNKRQYKYQVKLKILQNRQFVYYQDVAKRVSDNGAHFWYIKGLKERAIVPPGDSMYLSPKGQWIAEGYYDRGAGVFWSKDTMSVTTFEQQISQNQLDHTRGGVVDRNFQPMTSTQRSLQSNQVTKAVLRRGQSIWNILWQLTPLLFMLIIFILVLIFWNDIAKPVLAVQSAQADTLKTITQIQQQNLRFYTMLTGGRGNGTYIVQQIPGDEQLFPAGAPP